VQDVDRVRRVGRGDDDAPVGHLADGERDVGVGLVAAGGDHHRGLVDPRRPVGVRVVEVTDHDGVPVVVEGGGFLDVLDEEDVVDTG
jgi:hypothetical protein